MTETPDPYRHLRKFAADVVERIADEVDEDATYTGFDLIFSLTGLANGILAGLAELPEYEGPVPADYMSPLPSVRAVGIPVEEADR